MTDSTEGQITERDAEMALAAKEMVMKALDHSNALKIQLVGTAENSQDEAPVLELPPKLVRLFADILDAMSRKETIHMVPQGRELSTQEAAAYLNVSRPFVVRLVDNQKLKARIVGRHRRIQFDDLVRLREEMQTNSALALKNLSQMYDDFE